MSLQDSLLSALFLFLATVVTLGGVLFYHRIRAWFENEMQRLEKSLPSNVQDLITQAATEAWAAANQSGAIGIVHSTLDAKIKWAASAADDVLKLHGYTVNIDIVTNAILTVIDSVFAGDKMQNVTPVPTAIPAPIAPIQPSVG